MDSGLNSRKVYQIQKDKKGYMWILTHDGIERYDGKNFKQYNIEITNTTQDTVMILNSSQDLTWMHVDNEQTLWICGRKGRVFRYNPLIDRFEEAFQVSDSYEEGAVPVTASFIDKQNHIWLPCKETIPLYDIATGMTTTLRHSITDEITCVEQIDDTHFFIGTDNGVRVFEITSGNQLEEISYDGLQNMQMQVTALCFDSTTSQLLIGSMQQGLYKFDYTNDNCIRLNGMGTDVSITCIVRQDENHLLIGSDGTGVQRLDMRDYRIDPYITADSGDENTITMSNNVTDIYIDENKRVWVASNPTGIIVRDDRYAQYTWYRHLAGNKQSLTNDVVNAILQDSDGDVWFATNNGISRYQPQSGQWHVYLNADDTAVSSRNHIFLSLCEVTPGVILAGGNGTGVYQINKRTGSTQLLNLQSYYPAGAQVRTDRYIRSILKDKQGYVWLGGYYSLQRIDLTRHEAQIFKDIRQITAMVEYKENILYIGTTQGLFMINKETGEQRRVTLPIEAGYIYTLCMGKENQLFIGTNGSGLLVYDMETTDVQRYHADNSEMLSNNVYSIVTDGQEYIFFSSDSGLSRFLFSGEERIINWTIDQGLSSNQFNASAATVLRNNYILFGSGEGAIGFEKDMQLPHVHTYNMVFSDFTVAYQPVYPDTPNSPLTNEIDSVSEVHLRANQNSFSITVSTINYDYPSNVVYSWMLEGFDKRANTPNNENVIHYTNVPSGNYTLRVQALSNENRNHVLQERTIAIYIARPLWFSWWAITIYVLIIASAAAFAWRLWNLHRDQKMNDEKLIFFTNTAHDIRTPLTLIKAPLEDISEKETLSEEGALNISTAIRNVNNLLRLTTNLISYGRMDLYSANMYVSEHELNIFMEETMRGFQAYADTKHISLTYHSSFKYLNVWFDKEKMESILKNIISNALKYTPEGGEVHVLATENKSTWSIEVKDTGIGIPAADQKKLFRTHFRASNAINSKVTGSGVGTVLVGKMVRLHKGTISFNSVEQKGTTVKLTFYKGYGHYEKAMLSTTQKQSAVKPSGEIIPEFNLDTSKQMATFEKMSEVRTSDEESKNKRRILIAEDNDELRAYLQQTLAEDYYVVVCENGKQAYDMVKDFNPDLVISDVMMPEMRGDELCHKLKNDIETSHIPVMLLTALNDDRNVLQGIQTGADEYVTKPFNLAILKATIANIMTNRAILRSKFANMELSNEQEATVSYTNQLDWKFMQTLKEQTEKYIGDPTFNIDVLASKMNMSRTSLYGKIKALTDLAPSDYVRQVRLKRAGELLRDGRYNVTEVSEITGFSDAKYFREVFKKHFGISPSKYSKGETAETTSAEDDAEA
ncbi:MAG: response regulator [Prevotellaceae bacterium]|jgi:signal transduction histidine kinase/ligand-binding sensor domain-containing protein/CheY-like chemotaxis protein/AraC-like DNA-binding protein|nr:response regulator [Prevotellaceae bacterium]